MYEAETYNSRSMTNPGITGLFNKNCLKSAMDNLITCAPGDNTYVGSEEVPIRLISDVSQFHSIYTTEETNGEVTIVCSQAGCGKYKPGCWCFWVFPKDE